MKEEIKLYRNFKKTRTLLLSSLGICILLALVILYSIGLFDGEMKVKPAVFSTGAFLIMLFLTIKCLLSLKDKSPLIEFSKEMFIGKTTPISKAVGQVDWIDVNDIQLQKMGGDTLVVVTIGNTDKYEGRISKMLWNMAFDKPSQQLQLMYSSSEVDIEPKPLFDLFISFWESANKKN
ncbi:hypothetical protein [Pedobacter nyackensis]|uniref:Uncharacterized protein n=1 Tax=Pedobacter nyackensis TaxID=475255 RepID=A0A1W2AQ05_9SPHI|nr:hypothetical protein [Pedobacter nyackensis]SMC62612.1 hypothetical protein SAMN04488101_101821 [Pedobacter nyackensis]